MARVPVEAWRARHRELPVFLLEQIANLIRLCCLWLGLGCAFLLRRGFLRSHGILAHGKTMREAVHLLGFALLLGRAIRFGRAIPGLFTIHTSDWGHGSLGGTFRSAIASNSHTQLAACTVAVPSAFVKRLRKKKTDPGASRRMVWGKSIGDKQTSRIKGRVG